MSTLHHFPKWLIDERFEITHAPSITLAPFTVVLFDRVQGRHYGHGYSIAEAAKAALRRRSSKPQAPNPKEAPTPKVFASRDPKLQKESTIRENSRPFAGNSSPS